MCVSTCVYTMNQSVQTGVYSEAGLSVSITLPWLSLPGPLSTQTCLNTHTQRQEAPHANGKALCTRPWREHIMGPSGLWGSWRNPTPKQWGPWKKDHFLHPVHSFDLHSRQHTFGYSCSSSLLTRPTEFKLISMSIHLTHKLLFNVSLQLFWSWTTFWPQVSFISSYSCWMLQWRPVGRFQQLQIIFYRNKVSSEWDMLWVRSDSKHVSV